MTPRSVSVIVPCFNGEAHIRRCLDGLTRQTYPDFEIVVVDDASTDGTLSVLKEYPDIRVVQNPENRGPAFSRNRGIEASRGDILVFLDSDCEVDDPEWLVKHVQVQAARSGSIVGGGIVGVGKGIIARADSYCHWFTNIPHGKSRVVSPFPRAPRIRFSRHLVTTNMSLHRDIWLAVGPFEEWLRTGEDLEFCERAVSRGFTLWLQPDITVRHHDRTHLGEFFRCFYRVGRDRVPARSRHRSQYHALMPRGVVSSLLFCLPIGLLAPLQPILAWFPYDKRAVLYYPLIAVASFAMAVGIVRYWIEQRKHDA
ncbi:MAG TPA: glycosyltransferase [Candidatus Deferrimicrobiaceae bacterium]|nr:glycosyltransferase [Candidatus Deferrimicrobiaceae bacterium]